MQYLLPKDPWVAASSTASITQLSEPMEQHLWSFISIGLKLLPGAIDAVADIAKRYKSIKACDFRIAPASARTVSSPAGSANLVIDNARKWRETKRIRCFFMKPPPVSDSVRPDICRLVEEYASIWSEFAGVQFKFMNSDFSLKPGSREHAIRSAAAEVRITLDPNGGSWSAVGTDW